MLTTIGQFGQALAAKKLGKRLPDDAPERSNPLLQQHKAFTDRQIEGFRQSWDPAGAHKDQLPVILDYVDSPIGNAWAFRHSDQYFIAINYGLYFILEFIFNYALANRAFLPEVGNAGVERDTVPRIPITTDYNKILDAVRKEGLSVNDFVPRDPARLNVARFLTAIAIRFLSAHEFRHVQAGHVDYRANNFSLLAIAELVSSSSDVDRMMKCQAMEWDADRFATHRVMELCWGTRQRALSNPQRYCSFYQDCKQLLFLCIFACSAYFRLSDNGSAPPRSQWETFTHPPSRNRRLIIIPTATIWAMTRDPRHVDQAMVDDILRSYVDLIEAQLAVIWSCELDAKYSSFVCSAALSHEAAIQASWKRIMPDLEKYSYVPLESLPV